MWKVLKAVTNAQGQITWGASTITPKPLVANNMNVAWSTQQPPKTIAPLWSTPQVTTSSYSWNSDDLYRQPAATPASSTPVPQTNTATPPSTNNAAANPVILRNQNTTPAPTTSTTTPPATTKKPAATQTKPTQLDQQSQIIDNQQKQLDYQTAEQTRLDEIRNNLSEAQVNNPNSFADRTTFEKTYNYASRSPEQKAILDASFSSFNNKWKWDLFNDLVSWVTIPPEQKKLPAYADAMKRKSDFDTYSAMPASQLAQFLGTAIKSWSDTLTDLRNFAPDLLHEAQVLKWKNDRLQTINSWMKKMLTVPKVDDNKRLSTQLVTPDPIPDSYESINKELWTKLGSDTALLDAFKWYVKDDPKIIAAQNTITEKRQAITNIKAQIANIQNRIMTQQVEGDAPKQFIYAMIAQLTKPFQTQLEFAQGELTNAEADFKMYHDIAYENFQAFQAQNAIDVQKQATAAWQAFQIQQADTAFDRQKELAQMWYAQSDKTNAVNFEQQKQLAEYQKKLEAQYPDYTVKINDDWSVTKTNNSTGDTTTTPAPTVWETSTIDFIKSKEWFRSEAYKDSTGKPTIGYWFTSIDWKAVKMWDTITQAQADVELQKQIARYQNFQNLVTVPLTNNQKTALTSFEYNLWSGIWTKSSWGAQEIIKAVNAGDFKKAGELMLQYNKANVWGKMTVLNGLTNRRTQEAALMTKPDTTPTTSGMSKADPQALLALATKLYETGGFEPKDVTSLWVSIQEFQAMAPKLYIENKKKEYWANWFEVVNPDLLFGKSKKAIEDISGTIPIANTLIRKMEEYKKLFEENGNERRPTDAKAKLSSLHKDITLNLKEQVENGGYNLWVLNGPDWNILVWVFPEVVNTITTNAGAKIDQAIKNTKAKIDANASRYWLVRTGVQTWFQSTETKPTSINANSSDEDILKDLNNYANK